MPKVSDAWASENGDAGDRNAIDEVEAQFILFLPIISIKGGRGSLQRGYIGTGYKCDRRELNDGMLLPTKDLFDTCFVFHLSMVL